MLRPWRRRWPSSRRPAPLPDGRGRSGLDGRGGGPRGGHVRLRPAHPAGPARHRMTSAGRFQLGRPARRPTTARSTRSAPARCAPATAGATCGTARGRANRRGGACSPSTTWPGCRDYSKPSGPPSPRGPWQRCENKVAADWNPGPCVNVLRSPIAGRIPSCTHASALLPPRRPRPRATQVFELGGVPLFIAVIFFVVFFLFLRPRQQRAKRRERESQLGIGDEVMSAGGIYGKIVAIDSDVVEVEVAPGVVLSFTRRAISTHCRRPGRPRLEDRRHTSPDRRPSTTPGGRGRLECP